MEEEGEARKVGRRERDEEESWRVAGKEGREDARKEWMLRERNGKRRGVAGREERENTGSVDAERRRIETRVAGKE